MNAQRSRVKVVIDTREHKPQRRRVLVGRITKGLMTVVAIDELLRDAINVPGETVEAKAV